MFYFLFLRVLRCFTSPRSLHTPYIFRCGSPHSHVAGFPHSDTLGSQPVYRLPEAYRRFPRPSSAPDAKASTMRSYTLITPKKFGCKMCVRKFHTKISQEKSHYITTQTNVRAVDARVHYTILKPLPNTTHTHTTEGCWSGRVGPVG